MEAVELLCFDVLGVVSGETSVQSVTTNSCGVFMVEQLLVFGLMNPKECVFWVELLIVVSVCGCTPEIQDYFEARH